MNTIVSRNWAFVLCLAMMMSILAFALPATATATEIIDPSDLSGWYKYDHYYDPDDSSGSSHNGQGGKHPYYYYAEQYRGSTTFYNDIASINNIVIPSGECAYVSQHIWVEGNRSDAVITFLGYSAPAYTDFLIYPTQSAEVKVIGFDIDAARIDTHTLSGLGALVNASIDSSGKLNGYLVYYKFTSQTSGTVHLVKLTDVSANDLHQGTFSINYSGGVSLGNFSMSGGSTKMRLEMEILPEELSVTQTPYDSSGNLGTPQVLKNGYALDNTGANGFGPLVEYTSHSCKSLSYVKFSNILMTINYTVIFNSNGGDTEANPTTIDNIGRNQKIGRLPAPPTKRGYVFAGWNTNADGSGVAFTADSVVSKNTTVYAQWKKIDDFININVTYDPDSAWTGGNVTATYEITCDVDDVVTVTIDGKPQTITPGQTVTGTYVVDQNGTIPIVVTTEQSGTKTGSIDVTWIDKESPTVSGLPNVISKGDLLTAGDFGSVSYTDPNSPGANVGTSPIEYASGVNSGTETLLLYDAATGNLIKEIPMGDLASQWSSIPSGEYYYDIKVEDNVGNIGYASDTAGGRIGSGGTNGGNPVVINPAGPVITETGRTPSTGWTNSGVVIDYNVKDQALITTIVIKDPYGNIVDTIPNASSKDYNNNFTATVNGDYTITAEDVAGNSTTYTLTVTNIDKNPPELTVGLTDGGKLETGKITYHDAPADIDNGCSGIADLLVTFTNSITGQTYTGSDPDAVIRSLPAGTYDVTVKVTDNAGNSVTDTKTGLTHGTVATVPGPTLKITGYADVATISIANGATLTVTGSDTTYKFAAGTGSGTGIILVTCPSGGSVIETVSANTGSAIKATVKFSGAGTYILKVLNSAGGATTKTVVVS